MFRTELGLLPEIARLPRCRSLCLAGTHLAMKETQWHAGLGAHTSRCSICRTARRIAYFTHSDQAPVHGDSVQLQYRVPES